MKKTFCLLMVLVLVLSAGCAKQDSIKPTNTEERWAYDEKLDMSSLPVEKLYEMVDGANLYSTWAEYQSKMGLEDLIVFIGEKAGMSTMGNATDRYAVTPLTVKKALYGNIKEGDTLFCEETAYVIYHNGIPTAHTLNAQPVIPNDKECLFILTPHHTKDNCYSTIFFGKHYFTPEDWEEQKEAQTPNVLYLELMNCYYAESYDPRLNLYAEISKLTDKELDPNGSREDWLDELTGEQKALVERMIDQYGTK